MHNQEFRRAFTPQIAAEGETGPHEEWRGVQHRIIDQDQSMPIRRYLQSRVFEPEIVEAMGIAFEKACQKLGLARTQDAATETVAKIIIDLAQRGDGDAERLCRGALAHFGVTAEESDISL